MGWIAYQKAAITLGRVEETRETHSRRRGSQREHSHSIARDETFARGQSTKLDGAGQAAIRLDIPADQSGNRLTAQGDQPIGYWELEINVKRQGHDYRGLFLLPVYSRQPESADATPATSG